MSQIQWNIGVAAKPTTPDAPAPVVVKKSKKSKVINVVMRRDPKWNEWDKANNYAVLTPAAIKRSEKGLIA